MIEAPIYQTVKYPRSVECTETTLERKQHVTTDTISYPHKELHRVPADLSSFWVITVLSNPVRYKRRYELYWKFAEMCEHAGVKLITVEQAFGQRPFMVTKPGNPFHLQVRSVEELWHKENMINMGVKHACAIAPPMGLKVDKIAWVDADCRSTRPPRDWFEETWHQLQHYEFVQMWEYLLDLDVTHAPIGGPQPSFMSNYIKYGTPTPEDFEALQSGKEQSRHHHERKHHHHKQERRRHKHRHDHHHHKHHHHKPEPTPTPVPAPPIYPYDSGTVFGRPGLAWAANIDAFNKVGGLIDYSILGAGDWYMAHGLIGSMQIVARDWSTTAYAKRMLQWQELCERWIKRDVGFVPGTVYHDFHGRKQFRGYGTRGQILTRNEYDPNTDIKYDAHGMLQLETWEPRQIRLRDEIRGYFRSRNEDSIDLK